jgi:predicted transcriptional regulator of viral defense system
MNKLTKNKAELIREVIEKLPFFCVGDLSVTGLTKNHSKTLLYRFSKNNEIVSLKRGYYVSWKFLENIEKRNIFNNYLEFVGNIIYKPSYLSAEYILEKYGVLSEGVTSFVLITEKKTNKFLNSLGVFKYYHIKPDLFCGFNVVDKDEFSIAEASLAKALFDFLYFRKNILLEKSQFDELRLNLDILTKKDVAEFKKYVNIEKSEKMRTIFSYVTKKYV